jgi:hypothetical protein
MGEIETSDCNSLNAGIAKHAISKQRHNSVCGRNFPNSTKIDELNRPSSYSHPQTYTLKQEPTPYPKQPKPYKILAKLML